MYNLLVVDDELVISKYISDLIRDSEELENVLLEVINVYSAYEALDILEEYPIDIVMTDISMPGMNGISLMEHIREKWPNIKIILISGYDEFEYAQAAIRNNGIDYVLKSEGEESFIKSVKRAVNKLDESLRNDEIIKKAEENLRLTNGILKERLITDILEGEKQDEEILEPYFEQLNMEINLSKPVFMVIAKVTSNHIKYISNAVIYHVKAVVEEHFRKGMLCESAVYDRRIVWLLQAEKGEIDGIRSMNHIANQLYRIQIVCRELLSVEVSFSTDQQYISWANLGIKFERLNSTLARTPITSGLILIGDNSFYNKDNKKRIEEETVTEKARLAIKQLNTLVANITEYDQEEFFKAFDSLTEVLNNLSPRYYVIKYEAVFTFASSFLSVLNKMSIDGTDFINDIILELKDDYDWSLMLNYFRNLAVWIFEELDENEYNNTNNVVDFIKSYCIEHLDENPTLNYFSDLLHYHPSYLSRMFKQVTSCTFSQYKAQIKAEKAKEMLCDGDLKIINIAHSLGFENASYFTRFFKKHTNLSPQDYRNKYCFV